MATASPPRRRTPAKKPQPVIQSTATGDFEPLHLTSTTGPVEAERVTIAYLDDYKLTMPASVAPNLALKAMRTQRKEGETAAMLVLLEEILGDEGFTKLTEWDALTTDNLIDLFKVVQHVAMGAMETPKSST